MGAINSKLRQYIYISINVTGDGNHTAQKNSAPQQRLEYITQKHDKHIESASERMNEPNERKKRNTFQCNGTHFASHGECAQLHETMQSTLFS